MKKAIFWLLFLITLPFRFILAVRSAIWHAKELRKTQPQMPRRRRWAATWWSFVLCMMGYVSFGSRQ